MRTNLATADHSRFSPQSTNFEIAEELMERAWISDEAVEDLARQVDVPSDQLLKGAEKLRHLWSEDPRGDEILLANDLLREGLHGLELKFDGRSFYQFDESHWVRISPNEIRSRLCVVYRRSPKAYSGTQASLISGALTGLKDLLFERCCPGAGAATPDHLINAANGEIRFSDNGEYEIRPNRMWSNMTAVSPVMINNIEACPLFDGMLQAVFAKANQPMEMVRHAEEIMAYALQSQRDIPAIIFLLGGGSNGKSAFLKILAALLGPDQVHPCQIETLSQDRFSQPALANKLVLMDDDARDGARINDGLLKSIAEAKPLVTRKAHDPESVTITARALPIISMNGSPRIDDSSYGFERRVYVMPFNRRFEVHEMDRQLPDKIIAGELSAILNRLLDAYVRLRRRGSFQEPEECVSAKAEMLAVANPVREFVSEGCREVEGARIRTSDLWKHYCIWTKERGHRSPVTQREFTSRLRAIGLRVYKSDGHATVCELIPMAEKPERP